MWRWLRAVAKAVEDTLSGWWWYVGVVASRLVWSPLGVVIVIGVSMIRGEGPVVMMVWASLIMAVEASLVVVVGASLVLVVGWKKYYGSCLRHSLAC